MRREPRGRYGLPVATHDAIPKDLSSIGVNASDDITIGSRELGSNGFPCRSAGDGSALKDADVAASQLPVDAGAVRTATFGVAILSARTLAVARAANGRWRCCGATRAGPRARHPAVARAALPTHASAASSPWRRHGCARRANNDAAARTAAHSHFTRMAGRAAASGRCGGQSPAYSKVSQQRGASGGQPWAEHDRTSQQKSCHAAHSRIAGGASWSPTTTVGE